MQYSQSLSQPALRYRGRYYPLNKPQIIVGSDPNCDIRIENNPRVLPMHAQIITQSGQIFLQYMEHSAAIWVNGSPASQQQLQDQDEIVLGDQATTLSLQLNWKPAGTDQTMILDKRARPTTDRHTAQPASNTGRHASQFADGTRQAPFVPQEPRPASMASASQEQLDFPVPDQSSVSIAHAVQFTSQGQASPNAASASQFAPQGQAAFAPQAQMPQTIASTPPLGGATALVYRPQIPTHVQSSAATNTTRYLCAAGHLDENFQDYVLRHIIHEERRALGEAYGVDMLAVVSWCKAGLRRINTRDAILGIIFLIICSIVGIKLLQEIAAAVQQVSQMNQYYAQGGYTLPFQDVLAIFLGVGLGQTLGLLLVLLIALGIEAGIKRIWPNSHPGFVSLLVLMFLLSIDIPFTFSFLLTLALWLVIFVELVIRYYGEATNHLRKNTFNAQARPVELGPALENKLRENFTTVQRNVVAYSGYRPFAGAGYYENGWSFAVDTSKGTPNPSTPKTRLASQPFTVSSIYSAVERDVRALGINDVLEIEGKLYVNGQFLPENAPFFSSAQLRPVTSVDPRLVEQYKEHPTEDIRYYQCLRFNFWRGEMIFTAFLRFIQRGKDLFIEVDYLLLPPMKKDYYWVDNKEITATAGMIWSLFKRSFDSPLKLWFGVPSRLLRSTLYTAEQQKLARVALNSPAFDYGAATSLRWEASDTSYHLFFQKLDEEMYLKIVEMQVLETIINFLDAHQIDTTELRERQQTILNNNTYVNGQNINIGAMATGQGGHASSNPAQTPFSSGPVQSGRQAQPTA